MQSLECMTSYTRQATGDVPRPLVGPSTTVTPRGVYLFGGRSVAGRTVMDGMFVLDLERMVWERVRREDGRGDVAWPRGRYFHTMDYWEDKLVLFGGMGTTTDDSGVACVMNDLWVYDLAYGVWEECTPALPRYTLVRTESIDGGVSKEGDLVVPVPRYAHLSVVVRDRLVVMGGQHLSNEYVFQEATFHLPSRRWLASRDVPQIRGSYRSVCVPVEWEQVRPARIEGNHGNHVDPSVDRLTFSRRRDSTGGHQSSPEEDVLTPEGDAYLFSNSNFTDVQRQLCAISLDPGAEAPSVRDLTPRLDASPSTTTTTSTALQPPGLRFPFAAQVGHHLVLGGTFLSASAQQFTLWALDLVAFTWRKIDAEVLEGTGERVVPSGQAGAHGLPEEGLAGGSWNRAVWWAERGVLVVFGNRYRSLQEDYEHRAINLDHIAIIDLEVFGVYRAPERTSIQGLTQVGNRARVLLSLKALHEGRLGDCRVVAEDGRAIRCSSRVLQARWAWYKNRLGTSSDTIYISESYPIVMAFLEYLYTLDLATALQHRIPVLSGLLMLAKQYGITHLKALAVHALHGRLEESTALGIYEAATLCECSSLQVRALKMVLAIQKRAGRGPGHRKQPSGAVPPNGGPEPGPSSEGDSARTIQGNGSAAGDAAGSANQAPRSAGAQGNADQQPGIGDMDGQLAMAFSCPPSAFSAPRPRRRSTSSRRSRRHYQTAIHDSPVVPPIRLFGESEEESQPSEEETDYEPATYRTRRASASVATVHHWTDGGDTVDDQGRFIARARKAEHHALPPMLPNAERRAVRLARKIASMGSFFHPGVGQSGLRIHTDERTARPRGNAYQLGLERVTSPGSSPPYSPATPTDLPLSGNGPEWRAPSPRATSFLVGQEDPGKLLSKLETLSLQKGHSRTRSLGLHGLW
ncbi:hypothetical protein NliqN6_5988 [Naganishia liquefaciens]|uniref:BTB domain-containing protein n=1 Tax=Naganishia liquefaciens TaxID=104408 RepID=A0A8H3TZ79_9TREE|nr:hypothetical protein NliqN6_5988 [Naganishia liquefaciens]